MIAFAADVVDAIVIAWRNLLILDYEDIKWEWNNYDNYLVDNTHFLCLQ